MRTRYLCLIASIMLFVVAANSQTVYKSSRYKKEPLWIQMMNDTTVNYFETIKAFREYFKDRALPREANELEGSDSFEKEIGLEEPGNSKKSEKEREREQRKINPKEQNYSAEVRAFKGWFYGIQPWVREDGSIIGPVEKQKIIDRQQKELKETEKMNGKK